VPMLKISALVLLLVTAQRHSHWRLRERTTLYRFLERIGRWSMLDVFENHLAGLPPSSWRRRG